jgi:hypothetical protein
MRACSQRTRFAVALRRGSHGGHPSQSRLCARRQQAALLRASVPALRRFFALAFFRSHEH